MALRLFDDLQRLGIGVWIDARNLVPGTKWRDAIRAAIRESTHFVALLSSISIRKRGYVQTELKIAFDVLDEIPADEIFVVPVRIDECVPTYPRLSELHWADLFPSYEDGLAKVLRAIRLGQADQNESGQGDGSNRTGGDGGNEDSRAVSRAGEQCSRCGSSIDASADRCKSCGQGLASPNVRAADRQRSALYDRYDVVSAGLIASGYRDRLEALRALVRKSAVVMTMSVSRAMGLFRSKDDDRSYLALSSPGDTGSWALASSVQAIAEHVLFPGYGREIAYATLSPTGDGIWRFGPVAVQLNERFITHRSSILDSAAPHLVNKMALADVWSAQASVFTSTFEDRDKLAVIKVGDRISSAKTADELSLLLLRQGDRPLRDDFMEVAIYGPITLEAVQAIRIRSPGVPEGMRELLRALARAAGVEYSEVG